MGGRYFAPRVRKPRVRVKVKGRRRKGAAGDLDRDTQPHRFEHTKETTRDGSGAEAQHKTQRAYEPANTRKSFRVSDGTVHFELCGERLVPYFVVGVFFCLAGRLGFAGEQETQVDF